MNITSTRRGLRLSAAAAIATVGLFGLVACSSGDADPAEKPTTSATTEAETETTEEAPASGSTKCSEEQVATLSSASGVSVPAAALAAATADFAPAAVIGDLPTVCVLNFDSAAGTGGYAVLSGGAATLAAAAANATAAGAQITEAGGTFTGSLDDLTIVGVNFTDLTQGTAGFENVEDLVVIASTGLLG
ncbi:MAG TPA: hypothetical protein VNJ54_04015 [Plantibacter sp.]|uniref:hypothetical protein n=1 Tax=unclassified Plantibacter TaxID=2624265 RepID=UPI002B930643|nr:hypothetical protein [Plantibacter sp.]